MRNQQQLLSSLWLIVIGTVLMAQPAIAEEGSRGAEKQERITRSSVANHQSLITEIRQTSELEQPLTEAKQLTQAVPPTGADTEKVAQITAVQLKPTEKGLEVILETAAEFPEVLTSTSGSSLITDIPNAQLRLPKGGAFRRDNPTQDIALVEVTNLDAKTIRVGVTGKAGVPTAEVSQSPQALILSVAAPPAPAPQPAPTQPPPTPAPTTPPPSEPQQPAAPEAPAPAPKPQAEEERLELTVTAEEEAGGYNVPDATTATKTDTPLRDIPQSIQVVPRQVIEDQQVIRVRDALRNVSGVVEANQSGGTSDTFISRGFAQSVSLQNGFRQGIRQGVNNVPETVNLERIEVLKGPASVLYGTLEPGGIINYVTKQPLEEPFYSTELQVGSRNFFQPSIDLSGPLNSDRTVLYRLNAAYQNADSFRNFDQGIERIFISPVVAWKVNDRTDLALELEYSKDERPFDRGLVAIGDEVADIPFDRVLGELDDVSERELFRAGYRLEHRFNENWRIRNAFQLIYENPNNQRFADSLELDEQTGELSREWNLFDGTWNVYNLQTNLIGEFATGPVEHTLLFGVDLARAIEKFDEGILPAPSINIFDPVYGTAPFPSRDEFALRRVDFKEDNLGIYLQDQIALFNNLKLLVGGRFDLVNQKGTEGGDLGDFVVGQQQDQAFTPRAGIVYQPIQPLSLYASFSQSFVPNSGTQADGSLLEPQRGTQYEVGVKSEFLDGRLSATLAAYQITKANVAVEDSNAREGVFIPVGKVRSRGVELDVVGEVLPGWNIIASYAHTDALITESTPESADLPEGNRLNGVPLNSASLWTTYEIQRGNWQGLGFGLGLFFVGEREGDLENTFQVPSYVRTDASIFYRRDNWRAGINIRNLFDIDYIENTGDRVRILPGEPLTILGTVSVEF